MKSTPHIHLFLNTYKGSMRRNGFKSLQHTFGLISLFGTILSFVALICIQNVYAAPTESTWIVDGGDENVAVSCSAVSGWYAIGDTFDDNIEVRNSSHDLIRKITRSEIDALLPHFALGGGPDGPSGLAWSDSGRLLFILVHDDTGTGQNTDGILRFDTFSGELSLFAALNLYNRGDFKPLLSAVHFEGTLYVGTYSDGIKVYQAGCEDETGILLKTLNLPTTGPIRGLCVDRSERLLFAANFQALYRADLDSASPIDFIEISEVSGISGITFSDNYAETGPGLFLLKDNSVLFVPPEQAIGISPYNPQNYWSATTPFFDIAASSDGRLVLAASEDARVLYENDNRLNFEDWKMDEFQQLVSFCKSLINPDGIPQGWVIDADVDATLEIDRFHPASPDGAAWVILALMLNERISNDPDAENLIEIILERYAGTTPDGIHPERTNDGIYHHWYDPNTGNAKADWPDEWATMSTMKICLAADRAAQFYPDNPSIQMSARKIIFGVKNWGSYIQESTDSLYLKALDPRGPDLSLAEPPFNEGVLFVQQSSTYGEKVSKDHYDRWLNRSLWPIASENCSTCGSVSGNTENVFPSAFITIYPFLLSADFRLKSEWQENVWNHLCHSAGWTDDHGPKVFTVFSAGTVDSICAVSGYNADSLSYHPCNVASIPALLGFSGWPEDHPYRPHSSALLGAAYHAYRLGLRQSFKGAFSYKPEILNRVAADETWKPNSAGLPDVVMGAISLAEHIVPGTIDDILAKPYGIKLSLQDAIFSLQVLTGLSPENFHYSTDLNSDEKIGSEDVILILQKLSEIR